MPEEHYLGNPLLKKANTQIEFTEEQIVEFAKCAQDPVYFAKNYMQIVTLDHGLQPFDMYPFQEKMLKSFHENRFNICKLPRQPLANDTIIPTPDGNKKIKQIKVGDFVYDSSGIPIRVIDKKSYGKTEACYELNFSGSDFAEGIVCDKDHLWGVYIEGEYVILSAEQIYGKKEDKVILKRKGTNNIIKNWEEDIVLSSIEKIAPTSVSCIEVDNRDHMFLCGENYIPTHNSGKSTTVVSYLLHYAIFNDNVNIAILANKAQTARDLLGRLQTGYENLPKWLQQGICSWNKGSLELENGSKIFAASTSASSVRGSTYNIIFLDEFAFVPNQVADSFFSSVYPTITSGKSSKVIVVSCVTKDTYLLTNNGYRKIETLIDPNKEGAYFTPTYTVRGNNKFYTSDVIVNNKKSPTNIIKTRYEEIECSQDHKLWAFKDGKYGYVESKNLSVGDYIALKYNQQIFGNDDYVGYNPEKGKSKNLFSCDYINEDIAYFIGLYVAEGYARNIISKNTGNNKGGQAIISCGDDISESLNKLNVPYTKIDDVHYVINSKQLIEFIQLLGFDISKKATEKVLPNKVLSWSKKNIVSLLRGMFDGDGCITKKGRITYTSTSRELTRQVQLLLANLGIIGSIYETTSEPTKLVKVYSTHYTIEITGNYAIKYFDEIGFGLSRKQERISYIKTSTRSGNNNDIIPNSSIIIEDNKNSDIRKLKLKSGRSKAFENYSRQFLLQKKQDLYAVSNETLKNFLEDNVQEDMIWLKIKDIQKSENEVFDVSLPDIEGDKWAHSVLYNNFLGHQTPKGLNHFYKLWDDAKKGKNEYVPIEVFWTDVPGRDEEFKKTTIANTSESQWRQEFESVSSETLIEIKDGNITKTVTIGELYNNILKS